MHSSQETAVASAAKPRERLKWTATFFAAAVIVHNADHLRQGVHAAHGDVFAVGTAGISPQSWLAASLEVVGAFSLALTGLLAHGSATHGAPARSSADGRRWPVTQFP